MFDIGSSLREARTRQGLFGAIRSRCKPAIPSCRRNQVRRPARGAGAGYDHYAYGKEMREAMETWSQHVERLVQPEDGTGKVRVLR